MRLMFGLYVNSCHMCGDPPGLIWVKNDYGTFLGAYSIPILKTTIFAYSKSLGYTEAFFRSKKPEKQTPIIKKVHQ